MDTGFNLEQLHTIITLCLGLICLVFGVTLLRFRIPENDTVKSYRLSVRILSIDYIALSVLVFVMIFFKLRNTPDDVFPFPVLLMSTSQGLIMSFALLSLYSPKKFARKNILRYNVAPLCVLIFLYFVMVAIFGDPVLDSIPDFFLNITQPTVFVRFLILAFNIYQIIFYNALLQKMAIRYVHSLNQYYSDTLQLKPEWARRNFYFAVMFGVMAIVSSLFKDLLIDAIFTAVFAIYYFFFALMYMDYKSIFTKLETGFLNDLTGSVPDEIPVFQPDDKKSFSWLIAKNYIITMRLYLRAGITINDMARIFNTNRTTFSTALNKHEGISFNSFINKLRIEHAKQLLLENPNLSIAEVSHLCGYSEQSNFARQFKILNNETPAAWIRSLQNIRQSN